MIPKIIHQCWFGTNPIPDEHRKYMETIRRKMPEYDIRLWNNGDLPDCRFVRECLKWKKYALLSDYMRLMVLEQYGGIYFDTDIEVFKPFDDLLGNNCFLGFETDDMRRPASNAVIGAIPGHPFVSECMDIMTWEINHRLKPYYGVKIGNILLQRKGITNTERQQIGDILVLDQKTMFSDYCKHHLSGSWHSPKNLASRFRSAGYRSTRFLAILKSKMTGLPSYP